MSPPLFFVHLFLGVAIQGHWCKLFIETSDEQSGSPPPPLFYLPLPESASLQRRRSSKEEHTYTQTVLHLRT